jgi:hypothetical protein
MVNDIAYLSIKYAFSLSETLPAMFSSVKAKFCHFPKDLLQYTSFN